MQADPLFGMLGYGGGMDFDSDKAYRCNLLLTDSMQCFFAPPGGVMYSDLVVTYFELIL